jgi:hypothetical protein
MTTTQHTDTLHNAHARNRVRKAAALARTAVDLGITVYSVEDLIDPVVRAQVLDYTRTDGSPRWDTASDETWAMVCDIIVAMTEER